MPPQSLLHTQQRPHIANFYLRNLRASLADSSMPQMDGMPALFEPHTAPDVCAKDSWCVTLSTRCADCSLVARFTYGCYAGDALNQAFVSQRRLFSTL